MTFKAPPHTQTILMVCSLFNKKKRNIFSTLESSGHPLFRCLKRNNYVGNDADRGNDKGTPFSF